MHIAKLIQLITKMFAIKFSSQQCTHGKLVIHAVIHHTAILLYILLNESCMFVHTNCSISRASSGIQKQISMCELRTLCNLHGFLIVIANRQPSNHVLYNDDLQILTIYAKAYSYVDMQ